MWKTTVVFGITVVLVLVLQFVWTSEVIPERAEVYDVNEKYLTDVFVNVKRYSRRSPYFINVEGTLVHTLGDNITLHGLFYEYLHNEYKRSFVELDLKMCDLFHKSPWKGILGGYLLKCGAECPAPPRRYFLHNITASLDRLPFVWPFEKAMLEAYAKFEPTQEIVVRARFYVTFKRDTPKGKSKMT